MNKPITLIASLILAVGIIGGALIITRGSRGVAPTNTDGNSTVVTMEGGTQIIEVSARGGYSPSLVSARAGVPTILRMRTKNTFDCSAAFVVPALGIRKMLPPSGATDFQIPAQRAGDELQGLCGMGMYSFTIRFN